MGHLFSNKNNASDDSSDVSQPLDDEVEEPEVSMALELSEIGNVLRSCFDELECCRIMLQLRKLPGAPPQLTHE